MIVRPSINLFATHLFRLLLAGVCWLVVSLPIVTLGASTAAYSHYISCIVSKDDSRLRNFFIGLRSYGWTGSVLFVIILIPVIVLAGNFYFFFLSDSFMATVYGMICFYLLIAWLLLVQFAFGLLTHKAFSSYLTFFKQLVSILRQSFWKSFFLFLPITLATLFSIPTVIALIFVCMPLHFLFVHHHLERYVKA